MFDYQSFHGEPKPLSQLTTGPTRIKNKILLILDNILSKKTSDIFKACFTVHYYS